MFERRTLCKMCPKGRFLQIWSHMISNLVTTTSNTHLIVSVLTMTSNAHLIVKVLKSTSSIILMNMTANLMFIAAQKSQYIQKSQQVHFFMATLIVKVHVLYLILTLAPLKYLCLCWIPCYKP